MWPAIVVGGIVSYGFSRLLAGTEGPAQPARRPAGPPPPQIEAHMEPTTRAGLERMLVGASPEQLDQGAVSLLRSGYPLAAQTCATRAQAMRAFEAQRSAAVAHRDRMMAAQAAQLAQAQALSSATANMQAVAAQMPPTPQVVGAGAVLPPMGPGTVTHRAPPETVHPAAPPADPAPAETLKARKARAPRAPKVAAVPVEHVNGSGRAGSDH